MRKWFGPSRKEIWRQLTEQLGARFVEGGFLKGDKVQVTHGEWTLTLDTEVVSTGKVTVVYTRMRAPYINPDGFRFTIYRRGFFSGVGKFFGMQDIEVGEEAFDRDFIVRANDEAKVRQLLSHPRMRELLQQQEELQLTVRDNEGWFGPTFPEDADELRFAVIGVIKDLPRLVALFELFSVTLDELCRMGAAYEHAPDVTL